MRIASDAAGAVAVHLLLRVGERRLLRWRVRRIAARVEFLLAEEAPAKYIEATDNLGDTRTRNLLENRNTIPCDERGTAIPLWNQMALHQRQPTVCTFLSGVLYSDSTGRWRSEKVVAGNVDANGAKL